MQVTEMLLRSRASCPLASPLRQLLVLEITPLLQIPVTSFVFWRWLWNTPNLLAGQLTSSPRNLQNYKKGDAFIFLFRHLFYHLFCTEARWIVKWKSVKSWGLGSKNHWRKTPDSNSTQRQRESVLQKLPAWMDQFIKIATDWRTLWALFIQGRGTF